ncbi:DUF2213 domain-containing protein [Alicyclobacillus acidoterrestris]|uniref:DUF2213 domain-containing protein n=1 Tax=Alicyclobacillus acidoterrestris TaxID=1450 RepID=UPI003F5355A3
MKAYFGSRISPNMTRTREGFLVCHNVPIARTGWYEYLPQELGLDGDGVIQVYRPEDEVFDDKAMASFEGKPLTNDHPPEGVDPSNFSQYAKGHATNIRRGKGQDDDLLLADIVANDEQIINDIVNGKREISAGYECDYEPNDDGTYTQRNIRGNHVALVDAGRAGDRVRINDRRPARDANNEAEEASKKYGIAVKKDGHRSPPEGYPRDREKYADPVNFKYPLTGEHKEAAVVYYNRPGERTKGEYTNEEWSIIGRRIVHALGDGYALKDGKIVTPDEREQQKVRDSGMSLKKALRKPLHASRVLMGAGWKSFVNDADPEEIADAMDVVAEELHGGDDTPTEEQKNNQPTGDDAEDQTDLEELKKQVSALTELVQKALAPKNEDEDPEKALDDAIAQMEDPETTVDEDEESQTIESQDEEGPVTDPEDRPQSGFKAADSAMAVAYLKDMKKAIAKLKDPAEKKMMVDAALKAVKGRPTKPSNTYQKMTKPKKAQDNKVTDISELGKQWMKANNPHYKNRI